MKNISKNNFKKVSEQLKVRPWCPGIIWKTSRDNGDGDFDVELIPLLKLLNTSFWHTTGSCAGHSLSDIKKEKKGWYVEVPYRITISIHVHQEYIQKFMKLMDTFHNVYDSFWCTLGHQYDFNNQVEEKYLPFEIIVFCGTKSRRDKLLKSYEEIARKSLKN
jgi:hypothetical protein